MDRQHKRFKERNIIPFASVSKNENLSIRANAIHFRNNGNETAFLWGVYELPPGTSESFICDEKEIYIVEVNVIFGTLGGSKRVDILIELTENAAGYVEK